jgi:hypothetical protein
MKSVAEGARLRGGIKVSAAFGFAIHTGWAIAVMIDGPQPTVLFRRRIELGSQEHDARFVYHAASERPAAAERLIADAARTARERAEAALRQALNEVAPKRARAAGLPQPKRALPPLDQILRSHPLIHLAEGELFRKALEDACRVLDLTVVIPKPTALPDLGAVGRPWTKDHKAAAALALGALAEHRR